MKMLFFRTLTNNKAHDKITKLKRQKAFMKFYDNNALLSEDTPIGFLIFQTLGSSMLIFTSQIPLYQNVFQSKKTSPLRKREDVESPQKTSLK